MRLRPAPLEDWLRESYFTADIDISSSGVHSYSMAELRDLTALRHEDLDRLVFDDGYSLGAPAVRAAVSRHRGGVDPDRVMTTSGSGEALSLVMSALLTAGDEVVVVQPGYHLLVEYAVALGSTIKNWRLDPERDWRPSLDELAGLVTGRTKAIIVNFPQNPTGTTVSEADLHSIVALARDTGAYLLWDGAFNDLTYGTPPLPDVSALYERAVSFGSFSKSFGLPGLRFGWCVAPPELLTDCVHIRDYTTLHVSPLNELLAQAVLENAQSFIQPRLDQARANRALLLDWAATHSDLVSLTAPDGGVSAFPRLIDVPDVDAFCDALFQKRGVLVIPGSCFGSPQHIRVGFGGRTDQLTQGLERLADALKEARR
ncbi:capreomycidine synthase [Streptomyces sp. NPDC091292]|uniref:capreomycidine synthase n=1 Tax=Streptomyces sp. NPDC091292 TaxID=3365991 RepID=UPI00382C175C